MTAAPAFDHFAWKANVVYDPVAQNGSYQVTQFPTDVIDDLEAKIRGQFYSMLDAYNPLPQSLRDVLTKEILFLKDPQTGVVPTLLDLFGLKDLEFLVNPKKFSDPAQTSQPPTDDSIQIIYAFDDLNNLVRFLLQVRAPCSVWPWRRP